VSATTGLDFDAAGEKVKGKREKRQTKKNVIPDVLASLDKRKDAFETIKTALKEFFEGDTMKAIVMVDELDRCRPDYAISYLETIKHIFDIQGMVFVLALDHSQLEATAKSLFGDKLSFDEYLRKFVQRRVNLPEIEIGSGMHAMIENYMKKYIINSKRRTLFTNGEQSTIRDVFSVVRPNFRQAQEIFRIIGHILSERERMEKLPDAWVTGAIFLSIISVMRPEAFKNISSGIFDFQQTCSFLDEIISNVESNRRSRKQWLMRALAVGRLTGSATIDESMAQLFEALQQLGYEDADAISTEWKREVHPFFIAWGGRSDESNFRTICSYIEGVISFGNEAS